MEILKGENEMKKPKIIEIEVANDWGWCLLDLLGCISSYVKSWKIDEGEVYINKDGEMEDLFNDILYSNKEFFNIVREKHYVIQLKLWAINDKGENILYMRIADSSYVDIYIYDEIVYEKMKNEIGLKDNNVK